jgi:hypothetical protein
MKIQDASCWKIFGKRDWQNLFPMFQKFQSVWEHAVLATARKEVFESLQKAIKAKKAKIELTLVGCFGFCSEETLVNCYVPGQPLGYSA